MNENVEKKRSSLMNFICRNSRA